MFSRDALDSFMDKAHWLDRTTRGVKPYAMKTDITREVEKGQSSCQLYKNSHDMDNCKKFLDLSAGERSRYLTKNKFCFGCYDPL